MPMLINPYAFGGSFQVERSLRFNSPDLTYLTRIPVAAGNTTAWTFSCWVKRTKLGVMQRLFAANSNPAAFADSSYAAISINATDNISISGGATLYKLTSTAFRDLGAWMHIVLDANFNLYINGVLHTAFTTNVAPTLRPINTAIPHYIGQTGGNPAQFNDAYLSNIHFIDGQNLEPTAFAGIDPATGVWGPMTYAGLFGQNGFYLKFADNSGNTAATLGKDSSLMSNILPYSDNFAVWGLGNGAVLTPGIADPLGGASAYKLAASGGSAHPYAAFSVSATAGQRTTMTVYAKAGEYRQLLLYNGSVNGGYTYFDLVALTTSGAALGTGSNLVANIQPVGNGWYKCSVTVTYGTTGSEAVLPVAADTPVVNGNGIYIYRASLVNGDGIPAELQHTGNGAAVPDKNWTPSGFILTAGAGNDSLIDAPTNYGTDTGAGGEVRGNYCVLNPLDAGPGITLTEGNLQITNAVNKSVRGTLFFGSGKWYWEFTFVNAAGGYCSTGFARPSIQTVIEGTIGSQIGSWCYISSNGGKMSNGSYVAYGATYTTGDVIGTAVDADADTATFYKNGVSQGQAFSGLGITAANPVGPGWTSDTAGAVALFNFGQRPFAYAAPAGYMALCTQNMALVTPALPATFTGNANVNGPYVWANGMVETVTINGNVATRGTDFDRVAGGMKIRSASASFNVAGSNTITAATYSASVKNARGQGNP